MASPAWAVAIATFKMTLDFEGMKSSTALMGSDRFLGSSIKGFKKEVVIVGTLSPRLGSLQEEHCFLEGT